MAVFLDFKRQLKLWLEHIVHHVSDLQEETILFISFGPKDHRCSVWHSEKTVLIQATLQLFDFIDDQFSPDQLPDYIKIDVAYNLEKQSWNQIEQQVHHQFHNNHYRRGIGFDDSCSVAFLEQEIYGKAIIRGLSYDKPNFFDETNLNYAIKQKYRAT
ncbi:poly alpha-glucosyltransferase, partial [Acinetobacter baumannii]